MSSTNLIKNLLASFPHAKLIETHVSWVLLTGQYAYKIKKPVDFEFLDFSSLEKRRFYCQKELDLGQRLAPEIYLKVIPITGSVAHPQLSGEGPILEYALMMREFPQENLFNHLLQRGLLTGAMVEALGLLLADFHQNIAAATEESSFGTPEEVHAPTQQNFTQIAPLLEDQADLVQLNNLKNWADQQFQQHYARFLARKKNGFIRNGHGDLHLANIVLYKGQPLLFDSLEFNETFRWTDVMADLAFLMMDLTEKKQIGFARQLLNTYLQATSDYQGLYILPYYLSYRAVVRAKIALFRLKQIDVNSEEKKRIQEDYHNFMRLATFYTQAVKPCLLIMHGLSGSGKTTVAREFVKESGVIQINSDVVRKRLHRIPLQASSHSALNQGIYSPQATQETYQALLDLADLILNSGFSVLVDATFLQCAQREAFQNLAKKRAVDFYILHCQMSEKILENRVKQRHARRDTISEADLSILTAQQKMIEPLNEAEKKYTFLFTEEKASQKKALEKIFSNNHIEMLS